LRTAPDQPGGYLKMCCDEIREVLAELKQVNANLVLIAGILQALTAEMTIEREEEAAPDPLAAL